MDAFEFIGESYARLSKNEKRIVDYIMNDPDGVYLGVKDSPENWREITAEEKAEREEQYELSGISL